MKNMHRTVAMLLLFQCGFLLGGCVIDDPSVDTKGVSEVAPLDEQSIAGPASNSLQSNEATTNSALCQITRDLNPWTFVSVTCRKNNILSRAELYAAFVRCVDHRINVEYTATGTIFTTPTLGSFGPVSTARCNSSLDPVIGGGRT
jgi:hypothetical protein